MSQATVELPVTLTPELLTESAEAWRLCEGMPGASLLRLAILRDLLRSLHAEKSRYLAAGKKSDAQQFRFWESRIEDLRQGVELKGELKELLRGGVERKKRTRLIPQSLTAVLTEERLKRYDRKWEAEIAAEAAGLGWTFWTLCAWVSIPLAEDWNCRLRERLWPNGVILFVESLQQSPQTEGPSETLWKGQWTVLLQPKFKSPDELALDFERWPGAPESTPEIPEWNLLFSPRRGG